MSIANLRLDESAKLEFDVLITGADGVPTSRFVIEGKDYSISFPCRQVNEGVEVDISGLKNVLPAGEYPVRLEVVLENKIYTPMQDTIRLEPIVEINTKSKPSTQIKESVKILGKVNVTKKAIVNEETQKQIQAATDVLAYLKVSPSLEASPSEMINEALQAFESLSRSDLIALEKLLLVAESRGVAYDKSLVPSLYEAKKMEDEEEDDEDEIEDESEDDEDEKNQKEELEVKDSSDYKLSKSGKKVKAHKVVFNKGEEETPKVSEEKMSAFEAFMRKNKKPMTEDIEQMSEEELFEVLKKTDPAGKWISDFVHSKNPKFAGKTTKERMKMALGAYYGAQKNEEVHGKKRVNESPLAKGLVRNLLGK